METGSAYEFYQKGRKLLEEEHPAQAALVLEKAKTIEPAKQSILEALGIAYYNYGQASLALENFQRLLELNPGSSFAHFGVGQSLRKLGRIDAARGHLRMAVTMEPDSTIYKLALARCR